MVEEKLLEEQLGLLRQDEARLTESLFKCRGAIELCEHLLVQKPVTIKELGTMIGADVAEPEPL